MLRLSLSLCPHPLPIFIKVQTIEGLLVNHSGKMNSISLVNACSLKWRMDVWPIKCYVPDRGWNDSAEYLWNKGDERASIY